MNITTYLLESFLFRIHNPVNCIIPGLPVPHHLPDLPKFMSTAWWCYPPISSSVALFCFCLQPFPASGSFPKIWLFASGNQSTGASASASVLPMSIQSWFHLGLIDFIFLLPKRLSKVFSSTTVQKHQFLSTLPFLKPLWLLFLLIYPSWKSPKYLYSLSHYLTVIHFYKFNTYFTLPILLSKLLARREYVYTSVYTIILWVLLNKLE